MFEYAEEEEDDLEIFMDEEDLEPDERKGYSKGFVDGFEVKAEDTKYKDKLEGKDTTPKKEKIVGGFEVDAEDVRYKDNLEAGAPEQPEPPEEEEKEEKLPEIKKKEEYEL
ncbi:MAG: hypothetical protein JW754_01330 [Candidatus Aenigmarchaeota archaeon]|nr:hypothetical protein [Candidatus Aenigmarchaeota archaeon]